MFDITTVNNATSPHLIRIFKNECNSNRVIDFEKDVLNHLSENRLLESVDIFAKDAQLRFPGIRPIVGKKRIKIIFRRIRNRYSYINWKVENVFIANNKKVVYQWTVSGKFKSQSDYINEGVSVVEFDSNGEIISLVDYFFNTDFSE